MAVAGPGTEGWPVRESFLAPPPPGTPSGLCAVCHPATPLSWDREGILGSAVSLGRCYLWDTVGDEGAAITVPASAKPQSHCRHPCPTWSFEIDTTPERLDIYPAFGSDYTRLKYLYFTIGRIIATMTSRSVAVVVQFRRRKDDSDVDRFLQMWGALSRAGETGRQASQV